MPRISIDNFFVELCMSGTAEEVREAISLEHPDINARAAVVCDSGGKKIEIEASALMAACLGEHPETVRLLIQLGADINAKADVSDLEMDVLCLASAFSKTPEVIASLIDAGADVNAKNDNGMTAMMTVLGLNNNSEAIEPILKMLIDAGADVNAKMDNGVTALMIAAGSEENPEITRMLIKAGADVNAQTSDGRTALVYAMSGNPNQEIALLLQTAGASGFDAFAYSITH